MPEHPPTTVVSTPYGPMECLLDDGFLEHLQEFGTHQRSDTAVLQQLLRPGDAVLDVGAFIGTMAVPLAQAVGPSGKVVSFEPVPAHAELVRRNLERNGLTDRAEVVQALVGKTAGGGFLPDRLDMSAATTWFHESTDEQAIPVTTLDVWAAGADLGGRPLRLLKVDVEGWELDVLRGASELLEAHRPIVALEVARYQLSRTGDTLAGLQEFLEERGYRFLINVAERDSTSDAFSLAELPDLQLLGAALRDILAVPVETELPVAVGSAELVAPALARQGRQAPQAAAQTPAEIARRKARGALRRLRSLAGR